MATQQHKIMRQVLEAQGCPEDATHRIRGELRDAYYQRLLPLIERICTDQSAPGRIDRIDRLEIDLGEVPLEGLETALAGRFEAAFSRGLAAAIGEAPEIDSELELFEIFARTGSVPWWADLSERSLLETNLDGLIRRAPQALRRTLQTASDPQRMLSRIARAYPDRLLDALAGILAPPLPAACPSPGAAWVTLLESASRAQQRYTAHIARNLWWEEVLRAASAGGAAVSEARLFYRAVLTRLARRLGIAHRRLIEDLRRALDGRALPPAQAWVREIVETLWRELDAASTTSRESISVREKESTRADLAHLAALLGHAVAAFEADRALGRETSSSATAAALDALLRSALEHGLVAPGMAERYAALMRQAAPEGPSPAIPSELGATLLDALKKALQRKSPLPRQLAPPGTSSEEKGTPAASGSSFSDADEIYVENAGLVILWPFLERFFDHVGLLEEKAFRDEAARQRAAGLLHYLATGEAPQAEYLLPLNKVLCGIPLEEVFELGAPMTEAETEACDELLGAVIGHAPILREMSIPGFRASFLLRKGQLSARDGAWLLRVERETHDIVLDRFPWSVNLVKLPWMEAVMQVEW